MHAMCSDTSSFPRPCVYAQLQSGFEDEDDELEGEGEDGGASELRFSPQDAGVVLEPLFKAFCEGAANNPDDDVQGVCVCVWGGGWCMTVTLLLGFY